MPAWARVTSGMPSCFARLAVSWEVGTPWTRRSPFRTRSPRALTKAWAARPEPRPIRQPSATNSRARSTMVMNQFLSSAFNFDLFPDAVDLPAQIGVGFGPLFQKIFSGKPAQNQQILLGDFPHQGIRMQEQGRLAAWPHAAHHTILLLGHGAELVRPIKANDDLEIPLVAGLGHHLDHSFHQGQAAAGADDFRLVRIFELVKAVLDELHP